MNTNAGNGKGIGEAGGRRGPGAVLTAALSALALAGALLSAVRAEQLNVLPVSSGTYDDVSILQDGTPDGVNLTTLIAGAVGSSTDYRRVFLAFIVNDFETLTSGSLNLYYSVAGPYGSGAAVYRLTPGATPGFTYNMTAVNLGGIIGASSPVGAYYALAVTPLAGTNFFGVRSLLDGSGFSGTDENFSSAEGDQTPFLTVTGTLKRGTIVPAISAGTFDDRTYHQYDPADSANATTLTAAKGAYAGDDRAYLAFAVPQVAMAKALLFLYFNGASSGLYGDALLYRFTSVPPAWSWGLAVDPSYKTICRRHPGSGWYAVNVTTWITVGATNHFSIRGTETFDATGKSFDSAEGANAPYLWLMTPPPTGTSFIFR